MNLATVLAGMMRHDEARQEYAIILRAAPGRPTVHYDLGVCFFKEGRLDDAIAEFRQALDLDSNMVDARFNLDLALRQRSSEIEAFVP